MKRIALTFCAASIILFACNSSDKKGSTKEGSPDSTGTSSIKAPDNEWIPIDSATEMKAWMENSAVGEQHKMLAKLDGSWTGEVTTWMGKNGSPMKSISNTTNRMVMDGRYQVSEHSGDFGGMPFQGMSTTGYDNYKKKFFSTWIDNMGTGILKMEGDWDEASKKLTCAGKMTNPANGKECELKEVLTIIDDNNHTMEMWGPDSKTGVPYKNMEIKYTRKK